MKLLRFARSGVRTVAGEARLRVAGEQGLAAAVAHAYRSSPAGMDRGWMRRIEEVRRGLQATETRLDDGLTVGHVTRQASKRPRAARMLLALVREVRPTSVIEMGTCVGISGSYLAAGLALNGDGGRLITLEGSAARSDVARSTFARLGLPVDVRTGQFSETLVAALTDAQPVDLIFIDGHHVEDATVAYYRESLPYLRSGAVVVFDDIEWDKGMQRAWSTIGAMEETRLHVNVGGVGIVRVGRSVRDHGSGGD